MPRILLPRKRIKLSGRNINKEQDMKQVTLTLPFDIEEEEAKLYLAIKLFEEGKVSLGQASELAGYSKRAFMEILGKHGVPALNYPAEELERDLKNA